MCGRYRLSRRKQILEDHFHAISGVEDWSPRYNIAPTQLVPVICQNPRDPGRELSLFRWGLIPSWASDPRIATRMINELSSTSSVLGQSAFSISSRAFSLAASCENCVTRLPLQSLRSRSDSRYQIMPRQHCSFEEL